MGSVAVTGSASAHKAPASTQASRRRRGGRWQDSGWQCRRLALLELKFEAHRGALPERTADTNLAPHGLDQALAHRQSKARAGVMSIAVSDLHEGLEDLALACRSDADTVILDGKTQLAGLLPRLDDDRYRALIAELDRVPDQVEQDLAELAPVAKQRVRHFSGNVGHEGEPPCRGTCALYRENVVNRLAQAEGTTLDLYAARLDAREIQHVFKQLEQQGGSRANLRNILLLRWQGAGVLE